MFESFNRLFPVWAILFALLAAFLPAPFVELKSLIQPLLALIMFVMGLTLSLSDFATVLRAPKAIGIGVVLQYALMPLAALIISHLLDLSPELTIGMVLVGATSGGTASNVITWLAGGNVALSVSMTMVSTLLSVVMTPFLVWAYMGTSIEVPVAGMLMSIAQLVIAPIVLGTLVHQFASRTLARIEPALASIAMVAIVVIIAIVVALNAGRLASLGPIVALAVIAHNGVGLIGGYSLARVLGMDPRDSRTIAIEVGMQNSGLAASLASQFFTAGAALPGALFSVWHNISGSLLAGYWKRRALPAAATTEGQH
ncbi:bile acid:sodium symporter family protein [Phytohalomonas tamaricis]|uniref:bile acid:sodium symporter family protein n=1 Tax=Phytohalomonas tamaricis TaxID=2081032 RepID=UPI000D0B448D|nr:bile acid:sodium symporter family protein [Phytohalomonas tamaricis]